MLGVSGAIGGILGELSALMSAGGLGRRGLTDEEKASGGSSPVCVCRQFCPFIGIIHLRWASSSAMPVAAARWSIIGSAWCDRTESEDVVCMQRAHESASPSWRSFSATCPEA